MLSTVRRDDEEDVLPLTLYREMVMWWQEGQGDAMQSMVGEKWSLDVVLEESERSVAWRESGKTDGGDEEAGGHADGVSCSSRRTANGSRGGRGRRRRLRTRGSGVSRFRI